MRNRPGLLAGYAAVILIGAGCAARPAAPSAATPALAGPLVVRAADVPAPALGGISQRDPLSTPHAVTRIMRLAANARIPEHHHPGFEESFIVQQGELTLTLNDRPQPVRAGDVVLIPAGTVVSGTNGAEEAVVVVAFASNGTGRAFSTPGRPAH